MWVLTSLWNEAGQVYLLCRKNIDRKEMREAVVGIRIGKVVEDGIV